MKLMEVKTTNGSKIFINPDQITAVIDDSNHDHIIYFTNNRTVTIPFDEFDRLVLEGLEVVTIKKRKPGE